MNHQLSTSLPKDRAWLQFSAERLSDEQVQVDYELVIPLGEVDCRGTFDHKGRKTRPKSHRIVWLDPENRKHVPMGRTLIGTSNPIYPFNSFDGSLGLPFRDSAHSSWDNEKLGGLEVYYTFEGKIYRMI